MSTSCLSPASPAMLILRLPVTTPLSFLAPLAGAGALDTDSLEPDLTPAVLWLFSRFLNHLLCSELASEASDLSRNLNQLLPDLSLSPDSEPEPRLLARPLASSSFFRSLKYSLCHSLHDGRS